MAGQDIKAGEGRLRDGATMVRDAKQKFSKDAKNLQTKISGMATGWQGQGGNAFQGLAIAWEQRHERITRVLDDLADSLDETERDNVQNDANVGQGLTQIARGLDA